MKKLLTILAVAMALCLFCGAALAATNYDGVVTVDALKNDFLNSEENTLKSIFVTDIGDVDNIPHTADQEYVVWQVTGYPSYNEWVLTDVDDPDNYTIDLTYRWEWTVVATGAEESDEAVVTYKVEMWTDEKGYGHPYEANVIDDPDDYIAKDNDINARIEAGEIEFTGGEWPDIWSEIHDREEEVTFPDESQKVGVTVLVDPHTWNGTPIISGATCTKGGTSTAVCSICGKTGVTTKIGALGHDWKLVWDSNGNCTTGRSYHFECTRCDATKDGMTIEPTGHNFVSQVTGATDVYGLPDEYLANITVIEKPICLEYDGNTQYERFKAGTCIWDYCTNEGCTASNPDANNEISIWMYQHYLELVGGEEYDGHDWTAFIDVGKPATCAEPAYKTRACRRCGKIEYVEDGEPLQADYRLDKDISCKDVADGNGTLVYFCKNCRDNKTDTHPNIEVEITQDMIKSDDYNLIYIEDLDIYYVIQHELVEVANSRYVADENGNDVGKAVADATCGDYIYAKARCKVCGMAEDDWTMYISGPIEHDFTDWLEEKNYDGEIYWMRACRKCNYSEVKVQDHKPTTCVGEDHDWVVLNAEKYECEHYYWDAEFKCANCDATMVGEYFRDHEYTPLTPDLKAATCVETGLQVQKCIYCSDVIIVDTELVPHQPEHFDEYPATCANEGLAEAWYCPVCKTYFADEACTEVMGAARTVIPATGLHEYGEAEIVKPAKCEEDGIAIKTCAGCGKTITEVVPAIGHDWKEVAEVPATCTEAGVAAGKECQNEGCGAKEGFAPIPALGHDFSVVTPAVAATCEGEGLSKGVKCSRCDEYLVAPIVTAPLGHDIVTVPGQAPTCEKAGWTESSYCTRCDEKTVEATPIKPTGHTLKKTVVKADDYGNELEVLYTCENCDYSKTEYRSEFKVNNFEYDEDTYLATGDVELVKGEEKTVYARVAFFLEDGQCMIQIVPVNKDGSFKAGASGNFSHISVLIVDDDTYYNASDAIKNAYNK